MSVFVLTYHLSEYLANTTMVETWVGWVYGKCRVIIHRWETIVLKVRIEISLSLVIVNKQAKLSSLLLFFLKTKFFPIFHRFLLFVERRNLCVNFAGFFLSVKTTLKGYLNVFLIFSIFFVASFPPV